MSQPPEGWAPPQQQSYQGQPRTPASHQVPGRRRVFMWVILAINALFLVWLVSALGSGSTCEGMSGDQLSACQAGEGIGKGIVFFVVLLLWALVDVILGVIYLVTRRNN